MSSCINFCKNSHASGEVKTSNCAKRNITGISLVAVGVVAVVLAGLVASGVFEKMGLIGSNMYFVAGGLTVASLVPFLVGGYHLSSKVRPYQHRDRLPE